MSTSRETRFSPIIIEERKVAKCEICGTITDFRDFMGYCPNCKTFTNNLKEELMKIVLAYNSKITRIFNEEYEWHVSNRLTPELTILECNIMERTTNELLNFQQEIKNFMEDLELCEEKSNTEE